MCIYLLEFGSLLLHHLVVVQLVVCSEEFSIQFRLKTFFVKS